MKPENIVFRRDNPNKLALIGLSSVLALILLLYLIFLLLLFDNFSTDFGSACYKDECDTPDMKYSTHGTVRYQSHETWTQRKNTWRYDVEAIPLVGCYMVGLWLPFMEIEPNNKITDEVKRFADWGNRINAENHDSHINVSIFAHT